MTEASDDSVERFSLSIRFKRMWDLTYGFYHEHWMQLVFVEDLRVVKGTSSSKTMVSLRGRVVSGTYTFIISLRSRVDVSFMD